MGHASQSDRVALVTGAARGIGAAVAAQPARDGWRVAIGDLDGEAARARAAALCDTTPASVEGLTFNRLHQRPAVAL